MHWGHSKVINCENYKEANMDDVIEHINYVRDLIGVEYIGMGADFDGVGDLPDGLHDVTTYPVLFARLLENPTWSVSDIKKIAGENILRVMRTAERVKRRKAGEDPNDNTIIYDDLAMKKTNCSCKSIRDYTKQKDGEVSIF